MEIYSIRPSQTFQFRDNQKGNSRPEIAPHPQKNRPVNFQAVEEDMTEPNFSAISMAEIREIALKSFDQGAIDHDTFSTLYEGLPMHAIDPTGQVIDLSGVSETTPFDYRGFYQEQLQIAASIGDPRTARVLESVVAFLNSSPAV